MPKPWARIEVGYFDHPKFQAITANAIALWHEGKNYCDRFHTDGLIPRDVARRFRFGGKKSIDMLTTAIDFPKPDGSQYAPLWEPHAVGFKMHDYLDHNDCREAVLERMEDAADAAEIRKLANRERQAKYRAERKAKLIESVTRYVTESARDSHRDSTRDITRTCSTPTETETETPTETLKKDTERAPLRPMAPIHDRSHMKHAHCGRVCLHASLFGEFVRRRNHDGADTEIREWAMVVEREWGVDGPKARVETGDAFDFWRDRYREQWPAAPAAKPKAGKWDDWQPKAVRS